MASLGVALAVIIISSGVYVFLYSGTPVGSNSVSGNSAKSALVTFGADSYSAEVQALLTGFANSTGIMVAPPHSGGSNALASQIASGSQVDVFIPVALAAAAPSHLKGLSPGWAIGFASDQMVIAYSNATASLPAGARVVSLYERAASSNSTSDWNAVFSSLTSGAVKVGISDPNADPAGLRGWLVLEAAGQLYGRDNGSAYTAPLLKAGANVTGAAAANMVAPLEAGQMQFLFAYKSLAVAQHLSYFQLDPRINLGDPGLAASYARLTYRLATGTASGGPVVLCITVPTDAPNPSEAMQFVRYVVTDSGPVLRAYGLQVFSPPLLYNDTVAPQSLSQMLSQRVLSSGGRLGS